MQKIFDLMASEDQEQLIFCHDASSNLKAFIAINNTSLGPAMAGCRMWKYKKEEDAIADSIRLSSSMTLSSAIVGADFGGGSIVIWGNPRTEKSEPLFRALGRYLESLNGKVIASCGLGINPDDLIEIGRETSYTYCLPEMDGCGSKSFYATAMGIYHGMKACAKEVFGTATLENLTIAIQGVGNIGSRLIEIIKNAEKKTSLIISDINYDKIKNMQDKFPDIKISAPDDIIFSRCDILAPCALGGVISKDTIKNLKGKIIAGSANNLITDDSAAELLFKKKILMAPDFLINSGKIIEAYGELHNFSREKILEDTKKISSILSKIFRISREEERSPYSVAKELALKRIANLAKIKRIIC